MGRRSRRHRRHKNSGEAVQLNMAAMLDMAFQLLAFFVLTFRPSAIEGHLQVHMPPPIPLTNVNSEAPPDESGESGETLSGLETLDLYVTSNQNGDVSDLKVGTFPVVQGQLHPAAVRRLNEHLKSLFEIEGILFDRVQIHADGRLRYEELMKIVDVCTQQTLSDGKPMQRVNFMELGNAVGTDGGN